MVRCVYVCVRARAVCTTRVGTVFVNRNVQTVHIETASASATWYSDASSSLVLDIIILCEWCIFVLSLQYLLSETRKIEK